MATDSKKKLERELGGTIEMGDNKIVLNEQDHKAILAALIILLGSAINHSDAESSGKIILEFISDVKKADLNNYIFTVTDKVKTMTVSGRVISELAGAYSEGAITEWHVTRGGSREGSAREVKTLGSL